MTSTRTDPWARCVVVVAFALVATLGGSRQARACGRGGGGFGLTGPEVTAALFVGLAAGGLVASDIGFTIYDTAHAGRTKERSETWSKVETYLTIPQVAGGLLLSAAFPGRDTPVFLAFTTWPAALMVHGFYATNGNYGERWQAPFAIVGAMDLGLLTYDVGAAASGTRPSDWYGFFELLTGLAQTSFGIGFAAETGGSAAGYAMIATTVPAALATHGFLTMVLPRGDTYASSEAKTRAGLRFAPMTTVMGARGPVPGFGIQGAF